MANRHNDQIIFLSMSFYEIFSLAPLVGYNIYQEGKNTMFGSTDYDNYVMLVNVLILIRLLLSKQMQEDIPLEGHIKELYDIITGRVRLPPKIMVNADTDPYLLMKIHIPKQEYLIRSDVANLRSLVTNPSQELAQAYSHAQKSILEEMERNRENIESVVPMIRLQMALKTIDMKEKRLPYINERDEQEQLELECVHEWNGLLDMFWLQYNTILYVLQSVCGFRVKAFLLYDEQVQERDIFLFLTISQENLLKMGSKYRVKKQVDYTAFDFFLNDPTSKDDRPLKVNSQIREDQQVQTFLKKVNRYLRAPISRAQNVNIIDELELGYPDLSNYSLYNEQLNHFYNYVHSGSEILTPQQKEYLFYHNRRKLNPGVEKYYARLKKRRQFFDGIKDILPRYGYNVYEEPTFYEQFSMPSRHAKGLSFFGKLDHMLLYRPRVADEKGTLRLFTNMEETKLCYTLIKQQFEVDKLANAGIQILTLSNNFQKFGKDHTGRKTEQSKQASLAYQWPWHSYFSSIETIRNYTGDEVAYEILIKNFVIRFFSATAVPFVFIYIFEIEMPEIRLATINISAVLFTISFSIYMLLWQSKERQFIQNYSDVLETKVFLSQHRGPYIRNLLTDEENQFAINRGLLHFITNFICLIIIGTLLTILGAIFHGCRMLLVQIYDSLDHLVVDAVSLPHIIAYSIFFVIEYLFNTLLARRMFGLMTYLKNPSSDQEHRWYMDHFTFFYALGIELLGPVFLLLIEPFNRTSCYSNSCARQLYFYITSRYIIYLLIALGGVAYLLVFNYFLNKIVEATQEKEKKEHFFFQDRLMKLLSSSMEQAKKPEHNLQKLSFQVNLTSFVLYSSSVPISPVVTLLTVMIRYYGTRAGLLYEERRPINKSHQLIKFSTQLTYIYFMGIIVTSWINIISFQVVERHLQSWIELIATPLSEQAIFIFKLALTAIYAIILILLGSLVSKPIASLSDDTLVIRRKNKYKEYLTSRGILKSSGQRRAQQIVPVQSIFRTFNNDLSIYEQVRASIYRENMAEGEANEENLGSQVRLHMD